MDNPYLLSAPYSVSISAAPPYEQVASGLCLVKFAPTDLLLYNNFMTSGSKFVNDSFYENPANTECPMFFDLSDASTTYKATTINMNSVTFTNVDCYSCTKPQFSLTSQATNLYGINFNYIN